MGNISTWYCVGFTVFRFPAELLDSRLRSCQFLVIRGAFHGNKQTAFLYIRQAEFTEHIQPCHRSGSDNIRSLAVVNSGLFCSGVKTADVRKPEVAAGIMHNLSDILGKNFEGR